MPGPSRLAHWMRPVEDGTIGGLDPFPIGGELISVRLDAMKSIFAPEASGFASGTSGTSGSMAKSASAHINSSETKAGGENKRFSCPCVGWCLLRLPARFHELCCWRLRDYGPRVFCHASPGVRHEDTG